MSDRGLTKNQELGTKNSRSAAPYFNCEAPHRERCNDHRSSDGRQPTHFLKVFEKVKGLS